MLPVFFITAAAATGLFGAGKTTKAVADNLKANTINTKANADIEEAKETLERQRKEVSEALQHLGEEKLFILNNNVNAFLRTFERIKNVVAGHQLVDGIGEN